MLGEQRVNIGEQRQTLLDMICPDGMPRPCEGVLGEGVGEGGVMDVLLRGGLTHGVGMCVTSIVYLPCLI